MNFEFYKNKYFHVYEDDKYRAIEVFVTTNHLVYGGNIITYINKAAALCDLRSIFEEVKTKTSLKEVLDYLQWRFTTLPEEHRMGDF